MQCADIKAPLDYQNPDGLQINVSVMRVQAEEGAQQKPNMFFNPGGPGGDGQLDAVYFSMLLSGGNPETTLGAKYKELSESYNFVGFSPRGVGASTHIICAGNELSYEIDPTRWGNDSAENIRRLTDSARYTASNCQKNPVSPFIHTDATARDMDIMRHLLGDEKLHYYGISYGTWLGFWYAGVFPDRVGPMVLDSNMNYSRSIHDASIRYLDGVVHTFLNHVAPLAARLDNIFHMGTSAESITASLKGIGREVNQGLLDTGGSFRAEPDELPPYITSVKAAIEVQSRLDQGKTIDQVKAELTTGTHIDNEEMNELFHARAGALLDRMAQRSQPAFYTRPSTFYLDNSDSVFGTVVCNDEPINPPDQVYWVDTGFAQAARLPLVSNMVAAQPCLYWNWNSYVIKPSIETLKDAPLLMVQSEFDVPTPLDGALETFEQLSGARMVRVNGEGSHGLMFYETECVDLTVMDYLLGTAPQSRLTECQAKPLPFEVVSSERSSLKSAAREPVSNFEDRELAERLLDRLKQAVGR